MHLLRAIVIATLVLCVLPWGAYSGAHAAAWKSPQASGYAPYQAAERQAMGATARAKMSAAVAKPAGKTCRIATLPGAPCSPDLGLPAGLAVTAQQEARAIFRPDPGFSGEGVKPPGLLDPPRLV